MPLKKQKIKYKKIQLVKNKCSLIFKSVFLLKNSKNYKNSSKQYKDYDLHCCYDWFFKYNFIMYQSIYLFIKK